MLPLYCYETCFDRRWWTLLDMTEEASRVEKPQIVEVLDLRAFVLGFQVDAKIGRALAPTLLPNKHSQMAPALQQHKRDCGFPLTWVLKCCC